MTLSSSPLFIDKFRFSCRAFRDMRRFVALRITSMRVLEVWLLNLRVQCFRSHSPDPVSVFKLLMSPLPWDARSLCSAALTSYPIIPGGDVVSRRDGDALPPGPVPAAVRVPGQDALPARVAVSAAVSQRQSLHLHGCSHIQVSLRRKGGGTSRYVFYDSITTEYYENKSYKAWFYCSCAWKKLQEFTTETTQTWLRNLHI